MIDEKNVKNKSTAVRDVKKVYVSYTATHEHTIDPFYFIVLHHHVSQSDFPLLSFSYFILLFLCISLHFFVQSFAASGSIISVSINVG